MFRMKGEDTYIHKVHYYETDRMGIVHHSNYIRWIEEARTEYTRLRGIDYAEMEAQGVLMPVINVNCSYKQSATFGDVVKIETSLRFFNGVRAVFSYAIYLKDKAHLIASAESKHCFIDKQTRRPVNIKKLFPENSKIMLRSLVKEVQ